MGLLERIGLRRKRALRPVGQRLESGFDDPDKDRRRNYLVKAGIFLGLLVTAMLVFPRMQSYVYNVEVGDIWRNEDLVSPRDFPIYKTDEELADDIVAIRLTIPPIFQTIPNPQVESLARVDSLALALGRVFSAYGGWQVNRLRGRQSEAAADSVRYLELRNSLDLEITPRQWTYLLESYAARAPGLAASSRASSNTLTLDALLLSYTRRVVQRVSANNILDVPRDSIITEEITKREGQTQRTLRKNNLAGIDEAILDARTRYESRFDGRPDTTSIGLAFFRQVFQPALVYMEAESEAQWDELESRIFPTRGLVKQDQRIVSQGEVISTEIKAKLSSLARTMTEERGAVELWQLTFGQLLLTLMAFLMFFLFLYLLRTDIFSDNRHVALISVLFILILAMYAVVVRIEGRPGLVVPVTIASILLTVIYDSRVGVFGTLSLAFLGGVYFGMDFEFMALTLFAAVIAVFSVRDIQRRAQFMMTAGLVFVAYALMLGAFSLLEIFPWEGTMLNKLAMVGINAVLVLFTYPLLWMFEKGFKVTTDITLLELSDTNQPLLRELSLKASGTFNHSLQVANLAEAACDAIGANALLVRVGALYHDIGKMNKPEYFIENQQGGINPHDKLKPSMSALILVNHVKDGLTMAKESRLPVVIQDFIVTHHGTHRIDYFYNKARAQAEPDAPQPREVDFRYPGPRPRSKEMGVLMLADSIEAASKSLDKPTPKKLEGLIEALVKNRIEDGQLDHCPLTFADLTKIKSTFLSVLSGIYHFRVKYPGQEEKDTPTEKESDTQVENVELTPNEEAKEAASG